MRRRSARSASATTLRPYSSSTRGALLTQAPGGLTAWAVFHGDAEVAEAGAQLVGERPLLRVAEFATHFHEQVDERIGGGLARAFVERDAENVKESYERAALRVEWL